ncbi:MAG: flavodoxin family protein [Candidatus Lokiarchaeia archaeon]
MKVLAIISSHQKKGNTATIISLIKEQMKSYAQKNGDSIKFETLFLGDYNINRCKGCSVCFKQREDKCPLKDDLLQVKSKIQEAEAVIFAGPVYVNAIDSTMKGLIDRLSHVSHRPEFFDKCALIIVTTHKSGIKETIKTIDHALLTWGFHVVGKKGFPMKHTSREEVNQMYHKDIAKLAEKLYSGVKRKKYLNPSLAQLVVFDIMRYYRSNPDNIAKGDIFALDYEYFHEQGWTDPKKTYFIEHRANPLKVLLAKLISGIVRLSF